MEDRFLSQNQCDKRLIDDYDKHHNIVVGFDFDNTVYDYHKRGDTYPEVIDLLKRCNKIGFTLVCFTANDDHDLVNAHLKKIGVTIFSINKSPLMNVNGKPFFSVLLDDRAGLPSAFRSLSDVVHYVEQSKEA